MERKPRRAYTGKEEGDWVKLVTEVDMNYRIADENNPPGFPTGRGGWPRTVVYGVEQGVRERSFEALERVEFTHTAYSVEGEQKRKRKSSAKTIKMGERDLRSVAPISVSPAAIPLQCVCDRKNLLEITQKFLLIFL